MSDTPTTPALKPEEWQRQAIDLHRGGDCFAIIDAPRNHLRLSIDDHQLDPVPAEKRHALAALCLYQQPFGFSSEDVKLLASRCEAIPDWGPPPSAPCGKCAVCSLASRIRSLLPPQP